MAKEQIWRISAQKIESQKLLRVNVYDIPSTCLSIRHRPVWTVYIIMKEGSFNKRNDITIN